MRTAVPADRRLLGDRLRFVLRPESDGCVLLFGHDGNGATYVNHEMGGKRRSDLRPHEFSDRDDAAKTAAGWDRCFIRLQALLAGASLDERQALELWPLLHERYAQTFGVDTTLGGRPTRSTPRPELRDVPAP